MTAHKSTAQSGAAGKRQPGAHTCYHCGEACPTDTILLEEKHFCCEGCKTVYQILNENDMCRYYDLDEQAGISLKGKEKEEYAYLDDADVRERLHDFTDGTQTKVTFFLPQIHCASCIWLLENLYKLSPGIIESRVNFLKKEVYITYLEAETSLRKVAELLSSIGYAPAINLGNLDEDNRPVVPKTFFYKLGVAGFAFGNIMLLSFPEYLGIDAGSDGFFVRIFGYLNILLALPVVFYSGRDYLQSAWLGLRQKDLNIDVPISLGILTLFGRSVFEIIAHTGAGYLDSLAGLVFFLLIGKWFQQRTYHNISFDRDYKSYFPIAAHKVVEGQEQSVPLDKLEAGDRILVKNKELIPADGIISKGKARIDYSFVTGESEPVHLPEGEKVYAGGRQTGPTLELLLTRKVAQSYLTQLWNDEAFAKKQETSASQLANKVGRYFTMVILAIATVTLAYWLPRDMSIAINSFTAVLIIACPCAVALAIPFIFGNALRILGKNHFYLKNTQVIEALDHIDHIVFDKTGTLTDRSNLSITYLGAPLSKEERLALLALTQNSNHPVSQAIQRYVQEQILTPKDQVLLNKWREDEGAGVQAVWQGIPVRLGSAAYMTAALPEGWAAQKGTYLQIGEQIRAGFVIQHGMRRGVNEVFSYFRQLGKMYLLSGDNAREKDTFAPLFGAEAQMHFQKTPEQKLGFIRQLQADKGHVLMVGDGLNDAGALKQSDVGLVVTEDTNNFTPASDAILRADRFDRLPEFIDFSRRSIRLVYGAYGFAFIYNIIGLSFAVQGTLSPIVAAILMPLSSISIVLFGVFSSNLLARRIGIN